MPGAPLWIGHLSEEDLVFLKRFLLAGGTLEDPAAQYGISYPTVRLRLDRLNEKVKLGDATPEGGPLEAANRPASRGRARDTRARLARPSALLKGQEERNP